MSHSSPPGGTRYDAARCRHESYELCRPPLTYAIFKCSDCGEPFTQNLLEQMGVDIVPWPAEFPPGWAYPADPKILWFGCFEEMPLSRR